MDSAVLTCTSRSIRARLDLEPKCTATAGKRGYLRVLECRGHLVTEQRSSDYYYDTLIQ